MLGWTTPVSECFTRLWHTTGAFTHEQSKSQVGSLNSQLRKADNTLSHRPRKRFGQNCCPEWFFCDSCGVRKVGLVTVDNIADSPLPLNAKQVGDQPDRALKGTLPWMTEFYAVMRPRTDAQYAPAL